MKRILPTLGSDKAAVKQAADKAGMPYLDRASGTRYAC